MKRILGLVLAAALPTSLALGQFSIIVEDDFNNPPTGTALGSTLNGLPWVEGGGESGDIISDQLQFDIPAGSDREWCYVDLTSISPYWNSTLTNNTAPIVWTFNMQTDCNVISGVGPNQNGLVYVLATNSQNFEIGEGYAVVLGNPGSLDRLRLVRYTEGLDMGTNMYNIIKGGDFLNEYLAVKVIYDPVTDNWTLQYASNEVTFPDPATASYSTIGSNVDATYTSLSNFLFTGPMFAHGPLDYIGRFDNLLIIQEWVLPITLETFEAYVFQNDVTLTWVTGTEIDNDYFTIEHSIDGKQYSAIAYVDGAGTSTEVNQYSYTHADLQAGTQYYRLVQTDYDGAQKYSDVITARIAGTSAQSAISPNPVMDQLHLNLSASASVQGALLIRNLQGQVVMEQMYTLETGQQSLSIDASGLESGSYILQLTDHVGNTEVFRFVKSH